MTKYEQYKVVLVNLEPTVGAEIKKSRPCLIISPNEMNYSNIIIAPMTTTKKDYPTRVKIKSNKPSYIVLDQIRTISTARVISPLPITISKEEIAEVKNILKLMLVD